MKQRYVFMYQVTNRFNKFLIHYSIDLDVPGAPRDAKVDSVDGDAVTLSWKAPEDDGGSYITNYVIEKLDSDTGKWIKAGTSRFSHTTLENLIPNKQYQFRILAENIFGTGEPSEPTKTVQTTGKNSIENKTLIEIFRCI